MLYRGDVEIVRNTIQGRFQGSLLLDQRRTALDLLAVFERSWRG
jgi:hypothetical protein